MRSFQKKKKKKSWSNLIAILKNLSGGGSQGGIEVCSTKQVVFKPSISITSTSIEQKTSFYPEIRGPHEMGWHEKKEK